MRASTAAAILAFMAGMTFAAPVADPRGHGGRIAGALEGAANGAGIVSNGLLINDSLNKREAEAEPRGRGRGRGRGGRAGGALEGAANGAGIVSNGLLINDSLNKREAEAEPRGRDRGHSRAEYVAGPFEGGDFKPNYDGIDLDKREAEAEPRGRGRGGRAGGALKGAANAAGIISDGLRIHDSLNPPQKREAEAEPRGRGGRVGGVHQDDSITVPNSNQPSSPLAVAAK
ncbi:hypothetical protein BU23DRAFT_576084 [Bimuria novae-zelandiae CBS 107.79]|uniref:Uncharacterized protein n=1 Tax=Bimuria novae-zelandiae CBS 107.79 TaxID=1447943 RepID=A0A6A5UIW0_9PLEO|nr:hypothetical protein BU23DRAFT_576084 [Bimuria novae-zelandiae CBS 107.79]